MSLSTLGQQLAALNAPGRNLGSALPSSTRHEDAVGRGLAHSVLLGHSSFAKSHLHKPSIIYEDSRKASDVPLTTLRENCVASLKLLEEEVDPAFGPYVSSLCKSNPQERALLTPGENEEIDKKLQDLLFRLALWMNSKKTTTSCLHVVEYLLRRYDIHIRPSTASTAILATLPCHEEPFFLRLLQLIDLANMPTWAFLRPYAAPGANLSRSVLSKQASKDTALLREICRLTHRNAKLPNASHSLSFTAAILVEAMTLQTRQFGSMNEKTCQAILPPVMSACRQTSSEAYQNWGHVIVSSIVESSVLAEEPRNVLVASILQGLSENSVKEVVVLNGLVVVLTILAQPLDGIETSPFILPMIQRQSTGSFTSSNSYFPCPMDKSIFQALLRVDRLAARLGKLHSAEGIVQILDWVASILVVAWGRLSKKKEGKKHKAIRECLLDLIQEPTLKSMWKQHKSQLTASFTSFVITQSNSEAIQSPPVKKDAKDDDDRVAKDDGDDTAKLVLQALRRIDAGAYDEGMAHALMGTERENRRQLATWLGLKVPDGNKDDALDDSPDDTYAMILPPRVALEHADAKVRLEAIPRVLEECNEDDMDVDSENDGESLVAALLRRFAVEEDGAVAVATGEALCGLLKKEDVTWTAELAEAALNALYKWTDFTGAVGTDCLSTVLALAVSIASHAVSDSQQELQIRLVEGIGAHIMGSGDEVSKKAIAGLSLALMGKGRSKSSPKKATLEQVYAMLLTDEQLLSGFCRSGGGKRVRRSEQTLRRRFVTVMLEAWSDCLGRNSKKTSKAKSSKLASDMVDYCLWMLDFVSSDLTDKELELLSVCLVHSAKHIASKEKLLPTYFHALAAESGPTFDKAIGPFIQTVCKNVRDQRGDPVAFLAVLMEITLSAAGSAIIVENLLTLAASYVKSGEDVPGIWYGVVPGLALLQHAEERVRTKALNFVCSVGDVIAKQPQDEWKSLNSICIHLSKNASSAVMGDASFLAKCLTAVIREADRPSDVQNCILKLCVFAAAACGQLGAIKAEEAFLGTWLSARPAWGGFHAAATVLDAAELAGEETFPLLLRWNLSGKVILDGLFATNEFAEDFLPAAGHLMDSVVRMLKGVKVVDSSFLHDAMPKIIISTGPGARGGRARSYSVGKSDGLCFLEPYPKEMQSALVEILNAEEDNSLKRYVRDTAIRSILSRRSWGDGVFLKLPRTMRRALATAVLTNACRDQADNADEALFSMPMDAVDVAELITTHSTKKSGVASLSFLADYVTANSKALTGSNAAYNLVSVLFLQLSSLSARKVEEVDEVDFVRQSITEALLHLVRDLDEGGDKSSVDDKSVEGWRDLLVALVGGNVASVHHTRSLPSFRGKLAALSVLTALCSAYPKLVAPSLVPAVLASTMTSTEDRDSRAAFESFAIVVPAYFKYARSAGLSLGQLFSAFAKAIQDLPIGDRNLSFCVSFVGALQLIPESQRENFSLVGGLCACLLAAEKAEKSDPAKLDQQLVNASQLVSGILESCDVNTMVESVLSLVVYSKDFMVLLNGGGDIESGHPLLPLEHIEKIAFSGPNIDMKSLSRRKSCDRKYASQERRAIMEVCRALMVAVSEALSSGQLRSFVRKSEGVASNLSLRLWQTLLHVQSSCFINPGGHGNEKEEVFWKNASELANESLEYLQTDLPCHIFLASATSLIKEGGTEEIRSRAVRFLADRALAVESSSPEAALFREMVPFLVDLLKSLTDSSVTDSKANGIILQQSVLAAVEIIARSLCIFQGGATKQNSWSGLFTGAIEMCANILEVNSANFDGTAESFSKVDNSSRQLICSASLCSATVVRVCGPKCLPTLPKLMKLLVNSICSSNSFVGASQDLIGEDSRNQARMVQLSVLRSLVAVADTLPQFLVPYLDGLLSPSALPSEWMRSEDAGQDFAVKTTADRLDEILSTRVPARQLVPAASKALCQNSQVKGIRSLLSTLNSSVKASPSIGIAAQRDHVLRAATYALEFEGTDAIDLMEDANQLLLSLILKLSEVQLRDVYGKLRDWRGNLDKADPQNMVLRRFAFWSVSALLGKELRSIFLPCLSTVFAGAVDELEFASSHLCVHGATKKIADGKKRRRLASDESAPFSAESLRCLQPLLLCLETCIRSDAHDGGQWVRADDARRYNLLIEPLGQLLRCRVPDASEPAKSDVDAYRLVVQGSGSGDGSVVGCLVAAAAAAGDEQLWKPLNHAVLQACSNEHRPEVRRAGVAALLSLIRSLGEEYMVLLPECLPSLSELLEDSDEEIAGLAQECIGLSEELLGESLQDSL